ncbi:tetratricopeptide repeat protein [Epilithonimonas sp. UC225_85]|uniref:tetratricopeptide repeat protein n=1 Tax=Epilithonimonas sp. UC225_85 TaxID=3350167 RepID=UPI0036D3579B
MKRYIFILLIFSFTGILKSQYNEQLYKKALSDVYQNPDNSLKIAQKMLKKEKNPDNIIKLYKLMSHSYISKRDYDKSLDWVLKMKELSKNVTNPEQKIKILNAVAIQYQQMGLYSKTLEILDQTYKDCSALPNGHFKSYYLGLNYAIRGLVYKSQNNNELALEKLTVGLGYLTKLGNYENSIANSSVFLYNIGYCYFYLNRYTEAEKYFRKSAEVARSVHAESLEAFAYKGLSENFTVLGKHQEAIVLLKKAVNLSKKVGDLVLSEGIYKGFSDNYLALQDWNNYEVYNKLYIETKFAREQSELASFNKSIDVLNAENNKKLEQQKNKSKIISFIIIILSFLISIYLVIKLIKNRTRNKILTEKLNQINKIVS